MASATGPRQKGRRLAPRPVLLVATLAAAALPTGCGNLCFVGICPQGVVEPEALPAPAGGLRFNPRLRLDLEHLSKQNLADRQDVFSDGTQVYPGRDSGTRLLSALYPQEVPARSLTRLPHSDVLWIAEDAAVLSYELIWSEPTLDGDPLVLSVESITRDKADEYTPSGDLANAVGWNRDWGFTDPRDRRRAIFFRGKTATFRHIEPVDIGYTVVLVLCPPGVVPGDVGCGTREISEELCDADANGRTRTYPWTVIGCQLRVRRDTDLYLMAADRDRHENVADSTPELQHAPHPVAPFLRIVEDQALLVRPLHETRPESCWIEPLSGEKRACDTRDEDPGDASKYLISQWEFSVADRPDGTGWVENFSPRLLVQTARIFVRREGCPDSRCYLPVYSLEVRESRDAAAPREVDCYPPDGGDEGGTEFSIQACDGLRVTPTYDTTRLFDPRQGEPVAKLTWEATFRVDAVGAQFLDELALRSGEAAFIEFNVGSAARMTGALRLDPPFLDLGDVAQGSTNKVERALTITNVGLNPESILDVTVTGSDARSFEAAVEPGRRLPLLLRPGRSVALDVTHLAGTPGLKTADIRVRSSATARTVEYLARVQARNTVADLLLLPEIRSFDVRGGQGMEALSQRVKTIVLGNVGSDTLRIGALEMRGPGATMFTALKRTGNTVEEDVLGPPASGPLELLPGETRDLVLVYHPSAPGVHRATLAVSSNSIEGEETLEIRGYCAPGPPACAFGAPPGARP